MNSTRPSANEPSNQGSVFHGPRDRRAGTSAARRREHRADQHRERREEDQLVEPRRVDREAVVDEYQREARRSRRRPSRRASSRCTDHGRPRGAGRRSSFGIANRFATPNEPGAVARPDARTSASRPRTRFLATDSHNRAVMRKGRVHRLEILHETQRVVDRPADVVHRDAVADTEQQETAVAEFFRQARLLGSANSVCGSIWPRFTDSGLSFQYSSSFGDEPFSITRLVDRALFQLFRVLVAQRRSACRPLRDAIEHRVRRRDHAECVQAAIEDPGTSCRRNRRRPSRPA